MIAGKLASAGIFRPEDIELLARVFASTSREGESDVDREGRAMRIIQLFQSGFRHEDELIGRLRDRSAA